MVNQLQLTLPGGAVEPKSPLAETPTKMDLPGPGESQGGTMRLTTRCTLVLILAAIPPTAVVAYRVDGVRETQPADGRGG